MGWTAEGWFGGWGGKGRQGEMGKEGKVVPVTRLGHMTERGSKCVALE